MESHMLRLEMMKLSRLWPHQPDSAEWWQRIKARPSYAAASTKWLRPGDSSRYEHLADPWIEVRENLAVEQGKNTEGSHG